NGGDVPIFVALRRHSRYCRMMKEPSRFDVRAALQTTPMSSGPRMRLYSSVILAAALSLAVFFFSGPVFSGESKKPTPPSPEAVRFFETKIRPVLASNCFRCHGYRANPKGNLRLDSLAGMLEGGDRGLAIVPGHPEKSLLIKAIQHEDPNLKM